MEDQLADNEEDDGLKKWNRLKINEAEWITEDGHRLHNVLLTAKLPTLQKDSTRSQLNTTWSRTALKQHTVNEIHIPDNSLAS